MMKSFALLFALVPSLATAAPTQALFVPQTIAEFPNPTWLENIAATCDGHLLTGTVGTPDLYKVDPFTGSKDLIHTFAGKTAVMGITEMTPNKYAVIAGNFSLPAGPIQGTFSLFNVDLTTKPRISLIANFSNATMLNGAAAINNHTVLLADSVQGNILKVDVNNGFTTVALDNPAFKTPGTPLGFGLDGVRYQKGHLYYSNIDQALLGRVKLSENGTAIGPYTTLAGNVSVADDFAVTDDDTVLLTRGGDNLITRITLNGTVENVVGSLNSSALAGPTSVTLGRTVYDSNVAYVSTNGGQVFPINGTAVVAGKIVAFRYR